MEWKITTDLFTSCATDYRPLFVYKLNPRSIMLHQTLTVAHFVKESPPWLIPVFTAARHSSLSIARWILSHSSPYLFNTNCKINPPPPVVYCIKFSDWILTCDVPTAVNIITTELWTVTPCGLGYRYKCFEYTCCTHLQDVTTLKTCQTARWHGPNGNNV